MRSAIGIDVGGTKCLGVRVDASGAVVDEARYPTPLGSDALVDVLVKMVSELEPADGVGIGAAGLVTRDGVFRAAPNLTGIRDLRLREQLEQRLDRTVAVDNDATCALVSEWRLGAAQGADEVTLVTLGTGIGGAIVAGGQIQRGANGFTGEVGHIVVDPRGPRCVCGRRGCWERYASGSGLAWLAREAAVAGALDHLVESAGGDPAAVRSEHVVAAAEAGDSAANAVIDDFGWWVAVGLVNLTNILDPAVIVVGGGLVEVGERLMRPVRRHFAELLYSPDLRPHPDIRPAAMGERAGAIGAALVAMGRG
jgi:glucokinase